MRYLMILALLANATILQAQKFVFPKLPLQGGSIASLIPSKWKAIDTVFGDLNHDRLADMALIFEYDEPVSEMRAYGDGDSEIIREFQKPRMLAVYFKDKGRFHFALQNNDFILRDKEGGIYGDPLEEVTISNNLLNLCFRGGSNWRWKLDYHFKFEHQNWTLIGAKNLYYHNGSGEMEEKEYNFITKQVTETFGNLKDEHAGQTKTYALNLAEPRTLSTFKKPWTWEIRKDEFL